MNPVTLAKDILEALGLGGHRVTKLALKFEAKAEPIVEIECYQDDRSSHLPPLLKRCKLVPEDTFDLIEHLKRQRAFSEKTFGPGVRTAGVLDHIRKELREIEADPTDMKEWVDVLILAFDGAWRAGWSPAAIVEALQEKQSRNEARTWPDWRKADPNKAIEHDRSAEV